MRKLISALVFALLFGLTAQSAEAKRLLPRFRNNSAPASAPTYSYSGVTVSPRLRGDRAALLVYFANIQKATSITYRLTYDTGEKTEAVGGSVDPSEGATASRELLFGTCSSGVCNYHKNITNMRFEVTSKLTSGKTSIKRFLVRI